jgi:hypothetical protein
MRDRMREYVVRAQYDGFHCIVFVLDEETPHARPALVNDIRNAFEELCLLLQDDQQLQDVKVGLVITRNCLECWLLADVQAIVRFACRRGKQVNYSPAQPGDTERFSPNEAANEITHILREVSKRQGKRDVKRIRYEKSAIADIMQHVIVSPETVDRNRSLVYFCEIVTCERSGCDHPQSGNEL